MQKHSAFVYETVRLVEHPRLTLEVANGASLRHGTRATCSHCRRQNRPRADVHAADAALRLRDPVAHPRRLPLCDAPNVSCLRCGLKVEAIPWATGKHRLADAYAWCLWLAGSAAFVKVLTVVQFWELWHNRWRGDREPECGWESD